MNQFFSLRFLKFLAAGGFGSLSYVVFSYLFTSLGVRAWIASTVVYCCLIPLIYSIQKWFVFQSRNSHLSSFPKYFLIQLSGLFLSAAIPFALSSLNSNPAYSFIIVILCITPLNYFLQSRWAFLSQN